MAAVPVRRPKSWKREREETRSKHLRKPKEFATPIVSSDVMNSVISNHNKSSVNLPKRSFTVSHPFGYKVNDRCINGFETFVESVSNVYNGIKSRDRAVNGKTYVSNFLKSKVNYQDISCSSRKQNHAFKRTEPSEQKNLEILKSNIFKTSNHEKSPTNPIISLIDDCGDKSDCTVKRSEVTLSDYCQLKNCIQNTCAENNVRTDGIREVYNSVYDLYCDDIKMEDKRHSEVSSMFENGALQSTSASCSQGHRKCKSDFGHVLPFRDSAVRCVQSSPRLSSDMTDNFVRRVNTDLGVLDAYLDKKVNIGSFGDGITTDPCEVMLGDCGMSHVCPNGDYDDAHKYLLNSGLIGYVVGHDRSIETITTSPDTMTAIENMIVSVNEEDRQDVITFFSEPLQRIYIKSKLRVINSNLSLLRPDSGHINTLDSSLKKNTTFIRKLKSFTSSQLDTLLNDMISLNLTKYVSEAAAALVECKLKMSDVWAAVLLCSIFHQMYADFSTYCLENWQKTLCVKREEQISNPSKLRVDLRFFAELVSIGVFTRKEGLSLIGNILTTLTSLDRQDHYNVKIILSFCRHCGDEYAGLVPQKVKLLSQKYNIAIPQCTLLPEEKQLNVRALFKDYYSSLCTHRLREHRKLQEFSRQNRRILHTRGELGVERKDRLEAAQVAFNQISTDTQLLAEALDEEVPVLPEDESLKNDGVVFIGSSEGDDTHQGGYLWDDNEMREFYESLPDLKQHVPNVQTKPPEPDIPISEECLDLEFEEDAFSETANEEEAFLVELEDVEEVDSVNNGSNKTAVDLFLSNLQNCITRELIDKAALEFVTSLNTKQNRRKVVKLLFTVPRIRLDLLPFYARFVASLYPIAPDVALDLAQMLKRNFKYHIRKKDQMNIESKIKVVRYIAELVKFNLYSKAEGLYCLKLLVQDFSHHHIEMCCNFLESCGRVLFRHPDCHPRMKYFLDQIMRKKSVMALDPRYVTMIETVYYYVNPPEESKPFVKERLDEEEFIRMLLYEKLEKSNVDEVLDLMQKLSWDDSRVTSYIVKCLSRPHKVKYFNIRYLASLVAGLTVDHELEGIQVVDCVLEDIQLGMEVNLPEYNQRRMAVVKYLGELYNYRLVENTNVFRVLQSLITFGVTYSHDIDSPLDPPENLFRLRLVCTLLATCGEYFSSGVSKRKLDVYLVYFQYYFYFKFSHPIWCEKYVFPCTLKYMFQDTVKNLRPNIALFASFSEAEKAVVKLCEQMVIDKSQYSDNLNTKDDDEESDTGQSDDATSKSSDEFSNDSVSSLSKSSSLSETDRIESLKCSQDDVAAVEADCRTNMTSNSENSIYDTPMKNNRNDSPLCVEPVDCIEEEEFLNEFNRMVSDNLRNRMNEIVKPHHFDIPIPVHVKSKMKQSDVHVKPEETSNASVDFLLILRKGNKQQFKSLAVPLNSEIAVNLMSHKEAERMEKECVKRLTLNISDRLEEEDYQEMLSQAQRPPTVSFNREKKYKYQHPKGAPDVDLIFSSRKVR